MILTFFKIIFVILLCVPLAYLMIFFITRLIEEVVDGTKSK